MFYLLRAIGRAVTMTVFLVGLVLSPNVYFAAQVLTRASEGVLAEYRLRQIPPERYDDEIRTALDGGDGDLARSLQVLAGERQVAIAPELAQRIASLPAVDIGNVLRQGWACVAQGDFDSEGGFACVVATDLTGVGDVRDLIGQGGNYLTGQPVNYFTLGVASVGLALTATTIASVGGSLPLRAGASFIKGMSKLGKIPPRLAVEMGGALARSIDKAALAETVDLAREFRIGEMQKPLARLFNPKAAAVITDLATDFGTIGKVGGVRAMKLSMETADSARDVKVLARTAERYQGGYLGVMKLVGRGVLRLGDLLLTLSGWLVGAALWLLGFAWFMLKTTSRTARFTARLFRRAPPRQRRTRRQREAAAATAVPAQ
jgi:hypothetical protein